MPEREGCASRFPVLCSRSALPTSDSAWKPLCYGGTGFLHEDGEQPFYLLRFGCPFPAKMLQPLLVVVGFESVVQFHGKGFLTQGSLTSFCDSCQPRMKRRS